jgi:hypothetical protein
MEADNSPRSFVSQKNLQIDSARQIDQVSQR